MFVDSLSGAVQAPCIRAHGILGRRYSRRDWHALVAVLLLAGLLRGFACGRLACISRDGVQFVTYARQLSEDPLTTMRTTTKQPGYAWLLLGVHRIVGPFIADAEPLAWQRCGQLIAFIGGVCSCAFIFMLTRRLFDTPVASVAGILAAVWPQSAHLSADVLSDMPHLALYCLTLLIAHQALQSGGIRYMALCGLLAGLAYLLRQEALGAATAASVCWVWPTHRLNWKHKVIGVVVLALVFAAVVCPHSIATGRLMPNKNLHDLLFGGPFAQASLFPPPAVFAWVLHWAAAPVRMLEAWSKSGRYVISTLFLLALFLKSAPQAEPVGRRLVLAAVVLQLLAVQLRVKSYGEISSRYLIIPLALAIPWSAAGLLTLLNLLCVRLRAVWNVKPVDVRTIGVVLAALPLLYYLARPVNHDKAAYRRAGQWLYQNAGREDLILAPEGLEQLMFYVGRTYPDRTWIAYAEDEPIEQMQVRVRSAGARWLVDAEGCRRKGVDETAYFQALLAGATPQLQTAFGGGSQGRQAYVFRITQKPVGTQTNQDHPAPHTNE
jgi:4-amino-4-deoxy-L-arabinose transferase-like glycosyltransferase